MEKVALWDLLNIEDIIAVEHGFKVLLLQELLLEVVDLLVQWIGILASVSVLDGLEHLQDFLLWVRWLVMQ